jgi:hypothetical protein
MRTPEEIAKDVEALAAEVLELLRNPITNRPTVIDDSYIGKTCYDDDEDLLKLVHIHTYEGGAIYVFVMIDDDGDMSVLQRNEKAIQSYKWN